MAGDADAGRWVDSEVNTSPSAATSAPNLAPSGSPGRRSLRRGNRHDLDLTYPTRFAYAQAGVGPCCQGTTQDSQPVPGERSRHKHRSGRQRSIATVLVGGPPPGDRLEPPLHAVDDTSRVGHAVQAYSFPASRPRLPAIRAPHDPPPVSPKPVADTETRSATEVARLPRGYSCELTHDPTSGGRPR